MLVIRQHRALMKILLSRGTHKLGSELGYEKEKAQQYFRLDSGETDAWLPFTLNVESFDSLREVVIPYLLKSELEQLIAVLLLIIFRDKARKSKMSADKFLEQEMKSMEEHDGNPDVQMEASTRWISEFMLATAGQLTEAILRVFHKWEVKAGDVTDEALNTLKSMMGMPDKFDVTATQEEESDEKDEEDDEEEDKGGFLTI